MSEPQSGPDLRPLEDKYEILSELRTNTRVRTYVARSRDDGADVVITVATEGENNALAHYASDTQLLTTASHPSIRVLGGHWVGKDFAVVRERVRGKSLHELLSTEERLANIRIAAILHEVHGVTDWARTSGVIHRGVTPKTVFFEEHTDRVLVSLSPTAIPIESLPDVAADARTLATLTWTMLTGSPPDGESLETAEERLAELRPDLAARVRRDVVATMHCKSGGGITPDIASFIAVITMADALKGAENEVERLRQEGEAEITRLKNESQLEITRLKEESVTEMARVRKEIETEAARLKQEAEADATRHRAELMAELKREREKWESDRRAREQDVEKQAKALAADREKIEAGVRTERANLEAERKKIEAELRVERDRGKTERERVAAELERIQADQKKVATERERIVTERKGLEERAAAELRKREQQIAAEVKELERRTAVQRRELEQRTARLEKQIAAFETRRAEVERAQAAETDRLAAMRREIELVRAEQEQRNLEEAAALPDTATVIPIATERRAEDRRSGKGWAFPIRRRRSDRHQSVARSLGRITPCSGAADSFGGLSDAPISCISSCAASPLPSIRRQSRAVFIAGRVGLRLRHPLDVFLPGARTEAVERLRCSLVLLERGHEIRRYRERRLRFRPRRPPPPSRRRRSTSRLS